MAGLQAYSIQDVTVNKVHTRVQVMIRSRAVSRRRVERSLTPQATPTATPHRSRGAGHAPRSPPARSSAPATADPSAYDYIHTTWFGLGPRRHDLRAPRGSRLYRAGTPPAPRLNATSRSAPPDAARRRRAGGHRRAAPEARRQSARSGFPFVGVAPARRRTQSHGTRPYSEFFSHISSSQKKCTAG